MASSQLSRWEEANGHAPQEPLFWSSLDSRLAQASVQHRALTKTLVDESRAATQVQLDSISQTCREVFDAHSRNVERLMEAHRRAANESLQEALQACRQLRRDLQDLQDQQGSTLQRLQEQVHGAAEEERLAVQQALRSVTEVLRRERTREHAEPRHAASAEDDEEAFVTPSQLAEAVEGLRAEVRREALAALEAWRPGSRSLAPATKSEDQEGTTLSASSDPVLQLPRPPLCPSLNDAGSGVPEPTADRPAEAESASPGEQRASPGASSRWSGDSIGSSRWDAEEFAFEESIWDAVVFIGSGHIGCFGSIFTAGALLVNVAMQISICFIINDALTRPAVSESDIRELEYWRTTVAHNIKYVDQFSWQSLAKRICEFHHAPMSASPIRWLNNIHDYMPSDADRDYFDPPPLGYWSVRAGDTLGQTMCCFALSIWWMTLFHEAHSIVDMAVSVGLLPKGGTVSVGLLPKGGTVLARTSKGYRLEALSGPRRWLIGAVIIMRACICVLLLVCGTLFLVSTISLSDLILNAAALEIVLKLDELVFLVFAPVTVRKLIRSMEPVPIKGSWACNGLDRKPVLALLLGTVAMVYVVTVQLGPQAEFLERARSAICDGNIDFIAGVDQAGMMWASDAESGNPYANQSLYYQGTRESVSDVTNTYPWRAIRHVIENQSAAYHGSRATGQWLTFNWYQGISGGWWSLERIVNLPVEEAIMNFNYACQDADRSDFDTWVSDFWRVALQILQESPGMPTAISSCEDIRRYCDDQGEAGVRTRQYCPETCGCHDPASNLTLVSAELGCPKSCRFSDLYRDKLSPMKCADFFPEEPQTINGTDVQALFLSGSMASWVEAYGRDFEAAMQQGGCPAALRLLRDSWLGDLCEETNSEGLRPITLVCPETCRCDRSGALMCPPACGLG